jgi:hypothetical protein
MFTPAALCRQAQAKKMGTAQARLCPSYETTPPRRLRARPNLLKQINLICPVQSSLQKYFSFHRPQITSRTFRIPSHTEGRIAIVTDVGAGCGGRGSVLRAMGLQGESKDL